MGKGKGRGREATINLLSKSGRNLLVFIEFKGSGRVGQERDGVLGTGYWVLGIKKPDTMVGFLCLARLTL